MDTIQKEKVGCLVAVRLGKSWSSFEGDFHGGDVIKTSVFSCICWIPSSVQLHTVFLGPSENRESIFRVELNLLFSTK